MTTQTLEGGDPLVVSSLDPTPACVCSTINMLSAGANAAWICLDNKGMPLHKIEEQIGDIPKPNLCHFKICKINLTFNLFIYVTIDMNE